MTKASRKPKSPIQSAYADPLTLLIRVAVWAAATLMIGILFFIVGYVLVKGLPYLRPSLFSLNYNSVNVSALPSIVNTVIMVVLTLVIAIPLGLSCAIFLTEYASKRSKIVTVIRLATETLTGIPSIVYGLFGFLFFVTAMKWGYSMAAGAGTLAIMVLPVTIRTSEEAIKSVPDVYREGSLGLGASKLRTIIKVVLPAAAPGILSGVILSIGRIVGETAALIYTSGTVAKVPDGIFSSGRTLAVHMFALSSEGLHTGEAYATGVILLIAVMGINLLASTLVKQWGSRK